MEWKIKNLDNPKMRIMVKLNTDLSINCIGQYRYKNEWYDITKRHFTKFEFTEKQFTNLVVELVKDLTHYEQNLHKMHKFFENYSEFEFLR